MSLCLIDVHGDIEGDFEWVEDLPRTRKELLIAIKEIENIKAEIKNPKEISLDFFDGLAYAEKVIDKKLAELKGDSNE